MTTGVCIPAIGAILGCVARSLVAACVVAAVLVCVAPAAAQQPEPGLHIDPKSPSAKQYAVPLEEARRGADPSRPLSDPVVPGARSAPSFGEGIGATETESRSLDARARSNGDSAREHGSRPEQRRTDAGDEAIVADAAAQPGAPPANGGSTALVVGAASLVVAVGAISGSLIRRRARR
jgi:hypothetical protein